MGFDDNRQSKVDIITRSKCPKCGSEKVWVYHTASPMQYCKCKNCGFCIKTVKE